MSSRPMGKATTQQSSDMKYAALQCIQQPHIVSYSVEIAGDHQCADTRPTEPSCGKLCHGRLWAENSEMKSLGCIPPSIWLYVSRKQEVCVDEAGGVTLVGQRYIHSTGSGSKGKARLLEKQWSPAFHPAWKRSQIRPLTLDNSPMG
jgi:hypothetical protein